MLQQTSEKHLNLPSFHFVLMLLAFCCFSCSRNAPPNVIILHTDQWRAQAFGYAGDPNVSTPNIDRLASESANVSLAVSGMPVCTPHRASLMTGQYPLTHGLFMNDVQLDTTATTLAKVYADAGYQTAYIGKWHLDGRGRSSFIPPGPRRQGFQYWKALECSHNYNQSAYYEGDSSEKKFWDGYDAIAQAKDAQQYIRDHADGETPFLLFLSWGTPHAPYQTAPEKYRQMYTAEDMQLHPNVPPEMEQKVKKDLAGYYAHGTALDDMVGDMMQTLRELKLLENTIVLFTSDHGDLLGSHRAYKKQQPYEESVRIPMLIRAPQLEAGDYPALVNSYDIMPTLLGLSGIDIPKTVQGQDYSGYLNQQETMPDTAAVLSCVQPFGQWNRFDHGGKEYRGLRTLRYTYARDLQGPWLLFDNEKDPFQMNNLAEAPEYQELVMEMNALLEQKLSEQGDEFLPGMDYIARWGYEVDEKQTVPYEN